MAESQARESRITSADPEKEAIKRQKEAKKEELRKQLALKKEELARIQMENQELLERQKQNSLSKSLNKDHFVSLCHEAKEKYAEFEDKIKKVEQKVLGKINPEFDLDIDKMFFKFVDGNLESESMFDFIKAEYLNLIIARKTFVKEEKERLKEERKKAKGDKRNNQSQRNNVSDRSAISSLTLSFSHQ